MSIIIIKNYKVFGNLTFDFDFWTKTLYTENKILTRI